MAWNFPVRESLAEAISDNDSSTRGALAPRVDFLLRGDWSDRDDGYSLPG